MHNIDLQNISGEKYGVSIYRNPFDTNFMSHLRINRWKNSHHLHLCLRLQNISLYGGTDTTSEEFGAIKE